MLSAHTICGLKKRHVPSGNVIYNKGGCNMGAESCIAAHSVLVMWVTESTDTLLLHWQKICRLYASAFYFTLKKTKWIRKTPNHFGLIWPCKHSSNQQKFCHSAFSWSFLIKFEIQCRKISALEVFNWLPSDSRNISSINWYETRCLLEMFAATGVAFSACEHVHISQTLRQINCLKLWHPYKLL